LNYKLFLNAELNNEDMIEKAACGVITRIVSKPITEEKSGKGDDENDASTGIQIWTRR
jgi:hypothetical protein